MKYVFIQIGCLVRYLAPLEMARLNLLEMAKDIENSYTKNFANADYSKIQTKILFHFGRQLLHLGISGWNADRLSAIPIEVLPGIPIDRIVEFGADHAANPATIHQFVLASQTKLSLSRPQVIALLTRLDSSSNHSSLAELLDKTSLPESQKIMRYVPFPLLRQWDWTKFGGRSPQFSFPQARSVLTGILKPNMRITAEKFRNDLGPFLHGLDCYVIRDIDLADVIPVIQFFTETQYNLQPEVARCLKDRLLLYLRSLLDTSGPQINSTFDPIPFSAYCINSKISTVTHDFFIHYKSFHSIPNPLEIVTISYLKFLSAIL